jgi:hypothetical protein
MKHTKTNRIWKRFAAMAFLLTILILTATTLTPLIPNSISI